MTLQELIERIRQEVAGLSPQPLSDRLLDGDVVAELVLPRVIELVTRDAVRDEYQMDALRQDHSLSVVSGVVSLPESIKEEYLDSINISDASGSYSEPMSYRRSWMDYTLINDSIGPVFTIRNRKMYYRQSGRPPGTFTGTLNINAITLPTLPVSVGATFSAKDNIVEKIITLTAQVIVGDVKLPGLDFNGQ